MKQIVFVFLIVLVHACNYKGNNPAYQGQDYSKYELSHLDSLYEKLDEPQPGEWLYDHEEESITLEEYINNEPRRPTSIRNKIYIQPIGDFDTISFKIIETTAEFLHSFFGLEVKINEPIGSDTIPKDQQRFFDEKQQWKTKYILHELLKPSLPSDAIVMLALTDHDLYPDDDWNFVFGQASLKDGVGVWSYFRMGSPYSPESAQLEFKKRVLKTAGHETLHMFSIKHCITYNCLLNGSNGEYESDHNPLYLCPLCLSKFCWNLGIDPTLHMQRMADFWHKEKIFSTSNFYKKCLKYTEEKH